MLADYRRRGILVTAPINYRDIDQEYSRLYLFCDVILSASCLLQVCAPYVGCAVFCPICDSIQSQFYYLKNTPTSFSAPLLMHSHTAGAPDTSSRAKIECRM